MYKQAEKADISNQSVHQEIHKHSRTSTGINSNKEKQQKNFLD